MKKIFKVIPVSETFAEEIRLTNKDMFGNEVKCYIATGKGPCRVSLQPFEVGVDERLLLSYTPFIIDNAFNQNGPIFIYKKRVEAYNDVYRFPPAIKADKKSFPLTLLGYNSDQKMIFTQLVGDDDVDILIEEILFNNPSINYLHVRNAEAGCYICKIERVIETANKLL